MNAGKRVSVTRGKVNQERCDDCGAEPRELAHSKNLTLTEVRVHASPDCPGYRLDLYLLGNAHHPHTVELAMGDLDDWIAEFPTPRHLLRAKVSVSVRRVGTIVDGVLAMDYGQWETIVDPRTVGADLLARHRRRRAA